MILCFGELLLRLSTPANLLLSQSASLNAAYGGAEFNVAVSLASLGHSVQYVTRLPNNDLSKAALYAIQAHKIRTDNIVFGGDRLGLYFLETGAGFRNPKVIYDRHSSSMATIEPEMINWKAVLKDVKWFHFSGITPAISQNAADTCLQALQVAEELSIPISIDLNFRQKLWNYNKKPIEIMHEILNYCDVIFGGIDAPEKILGILPQGKLTTSGTLSSDNIISISSQLLQIFPKAKVFSSTLRVTHHASHHTLQGLIYDKKKLYLSPEYDMDSMVDRVGGGDAYMAAFIHGLIDYKEDYQKITNFATAASVLKHYIHGDTNTASITDIENVMNSKGTAIER